MKENVVGENIRKRREQRGWTREKLALEADTSIATVSRLESGQQNYTEATLRKIATAFEIRISDFFIEHEEEIDMIAVYAACGTAGTLCPLVDDVEPVDHQLGPKIEGHRLFYILVDGSLCGGRIQPGDRILIDQDERIRSGDLVVIRLGETCCSLRRIHYFEDQIFIEAPPTWEEQRPQLVTIEEFAKYPKAKIIQASMSSF